MRMKLLSDANIYYRMLFSYKPKIFWDELLRSSFDLKGVGHFRKSNEENARLYEEKRRIIDDTLKTVNLAPSTRVLEVGCGVGYWTEFLREKGIRHYIGNDIARVSIDNLSRRYPDFSFVHGDISETEIAARPFDLVLIIDVTQHITDDSKFNAAIRRMWSAVAPGGYFLFTYCEPSTQNLLSHRLKLNRIEKSRELSAYVELFRLDFTILETRRFNDKHIALVRKSA